MVSLQLLHRILVFTLQLQLHLNISECSLSCQERIYLDSITSTPILERTDKYIPLEDLALLPHAEA